MKTERLLAFVILASCGTAHGQEAARTFVGEAAANADLPASVQAADGAVSLWADFDKAGEEVVPLYLINKTSAPVIFDSQDGDIYLKLETQDEKGVWVRAQTHRYSDCGNSYGGRTLQPGMHFRYSGYRSGAGREAKVRYSLHSGQTLISNVGNGRVSDADVEAARFDGMSLRGVPRTLRDAFDPEWKLRDAKPEHLVGCLMLLHAYGAVPALQREAARQMEAWKSNPAATEAEKSAVGEFASLLAAEWSEEVSADRLLHFCLEQIEKDDVKSKVSNSLAWNNVSDLAMVQFRSGRRSSRVAETIKPAEDWKRATLLAASRITQVAPGKTGGMSGVLSVGLLTDTFVSSEALEPLLKGAPYDTAKIAAYALARRGLTERLAELAMTLPKENQPVVLGALAAGGVSYEQTGLDGWGGVRRPPEGTKEESFWRHVFQTQPVQAAYGLLFIAPNDLGADAFGLIVLGGVRDHWKREVERDQAAKKFFVLEPHGYMHRLSVDFLAKAGREEDVPLFRALLSYGGYEEEKGHRDDGSGKGWTPYKRQQFGVRRSALEALKSLGEPVRQDVVLERDVTDPKHAIETTNGDKK